MPIDYNQYIEDMLDSYHNRRVLGQDEFTYAIEMLDTFPWLSRSIHRRGFDEMMDRLILNADERDLLSDLLHKFVYIGLEESETLIGKIINKLTEWDCSSADTVLLASRINPRENDGSNVFQKQLQDRLYGWANKNFVNFFDFRHRFHTVRNFNRIVLIDDFIGSGDTISNRLKVLTSEVLKVNPNCNIYIVALAGMNVAKTKHPELDSDKVYVPLWLEKSMDRVNDKHKVMVMDGILSRLRKSNNNFRHHSLLKYGYGYDDTAALYYNVHYRIPNNVLAIFWWGRFKKNKEIYNSMFRRS